MTAEAKAGMLTSSVDDKKRRAPQASINPCISTDVICMLLLP
jgi:hypothetical protein